MKTKKYEVYCQIDGEVKMFDIESHSLIKFMEDFINDKGELLTIALHEETEDKKVVDITEEILRDKKSFYNGRYSFYYYMYKDNKINKDTFQKIVKDLKTLMSESKNRTEYEQKFAEYQETLKL